jgi:hypothetical protein
MSSTVSPTASSSGGGASVSVSSSETRGATYCVEYGRAGSTSGVRATAAVLSTPWYVPDTYAARNRISGSVPNFMYPWPGARGSSYASGAPSTARLSLLENVRSPMRYDRCVSRPRSRPSSSRCDASSRCTPSDRPTRPICTNMSMKSGLANSSSENSSQMISRLGSGASGAPAARARS